MKKILYTLLAGALALASCSKSDEMPTVPQSETTTFTLLVDGATTRATSTITPTRYVMEVWSEDGTTAENVFENNTKNHAEITSGSAFTVTLDKTKAYTCLFWADSDTDNTAGAFNAASLKAISLNTGKDAVEAYHAKVAVAKGKNPAVAVTLKRAVAKITLTETAAVKTTDNIALKLSNIYPTFDVLTGIASGTAAEWIKTITLSATTGTIATLYFFAKTDKELSDLKFTYATEAEKTVTNIPVQQNFATNIKGEYSNVSSFTFTVTADDEWYTPNNDVDFGTKVYKVGDLYPNATAPIGVVFWVDANDASHNSTDKTSAKGKIVSLDEGQGYWGVYSTRESNDVTGIDSRDDGATATKNLITVRNGADFATDYYAFNWIYATKNGSNLDGRWYLPAVNELLSLYAAWNGDDSSTENDAARTAFDNKLTAAGGVKISTDYYWSSTEGDPFYALHVDFRNKASNVKYKNTSYRVAF